MTITRAVAGGLLCACLVAFGGPIAPAADGAQQRAGHQPSSRSSNSTTNAAGERMGQSYRDAGRSGNPGCDPSCDDGNPCTLDICNRICTTPSCEVFATVCSIDHPAVADGTSCNDGDSNTINDVCMAGVCDGTLASCPCWDGDLRVAEGLGFLSGLSLITDPEPLCDMDPPAVTEWDVMCTGVLTLAEYVHPDICGDFDIYGSLIRLGYLASDSEGGRRCEASITDAGYYSMFNIKARVEDLTAQELTDCQSLLRQVFDCQ